MGREDEDRRSDGDGPPGGEPFSLDDLVVPDDPRELAADSLALQRERRAQARLARLGRLVRTRRWRQYGLSGPIVVAVLTLVAAFASLMLLFQPRRPTAARPVPLDTGVRAAGQEGGLLPDLPLQRADGQTVGVRDYRPAVVAVLPRSCGCDARLRAFGLPALRHHLTFVLVGPEPPAVPADLAARSVVRASDPTGQLARLYHVGREPVLLLVRGDGVVNRVLMREPSGSALDGELAVLVATGS